MLVMRHAASSTTIDQPMPISSRLPPVMFASASGAYLSGSSPALQANVKSTAYSGSTAISASTVRARPCDTSSCSASAAQARRNAEPRIASPKTTGATTSPRPMPPMRASTPGGGGQRRQRSAPAPGPEGPGAPRGCSRGPSASPAPCYGPLSGLPGPPNGTGARDPPRANTE